MAHERAGGGPDHLLGIRELLDCITEGRAPVPSARHAVHVLEVIEAARESARTGRTVTIQPPASDLAPVWSYEAT